MTAVEVDRLRLRCDIGRREPARFALEDALRTELPDDDRLVLLQRLQVAPAGSSPHPAWRQAAMREAWAAATGGARHAGEDGAAEANCVWFASQAEAERLLLDRLLRGRAAVGWFWKLALPRWAGRPAVDWLADLLVEASAPGEERALLALAETCVTAGAGQVLVEALDRAAPRLTQGPVPRGFVPLRPLPPDPADAARGPAAVPRKAAAQALAASSPQVLALLRRLASMPPALPVLRSILKAQALRRSPALTLAPAMIEQTVDEALRRLSDTPPAPRTERRSAPRAEPARTKHSPASPAVPSPSVARPAASEPDRAPPVQPRRSDPLPAPIEPAAQTAERPAAEASLRLPQHSKHAGLWLAVPALGDMGLRDWLARHPELLDEHPGARLILAIAVHHRVAPGDAALVALGDLDRDAPAPEWTLQWRHGLDRWLRRHARRRLHDLINRPGSIEWEDQRLSLTFPLADADIRLRRRALDRDPGWTDWLGLSIRYRFQGPDGR